jgi:hypothetical protein
MSAVSEVIFHDSLWVVAGTAAPVIALTNSVTIGRLVALNRDILGLRRNEPDMWPVSLFMTRAAILCAMVSLVACLLLLIASGYALATGVDALPPGICSAGISISLGLLLPQIAFEAFVSVGAGEVVERQRGAP